MIKEVIKYNKEEETRQIALKEIWNHILEYTINYKTTENFFYPDDTNNIFFTNISENNFENFSYF
jgi:hypothetical protein